MALCSNCGKEMGAGIYCGSCGQRTGGGATPQYQPPQYQPPQQQWGQPQTQYGMPSYAPPVSVGTNGMAIASLVTCFVCGFIVPIILGHIALGQIRRTGEGGKGLAIAGLVIGYIQLAAAVLFFFAVLAAGSTGTDY